MNKIEVEDILISMRTPDNQETINNLLDKVRASDKTSLQNTIMQAGGTKEAITRFFESKISEPKQYYPKTYFNKQIFFIWDNW